MPISIESLPVVRIDYTNRGPGLHSGLTQLSAMLNADGGRKGYALLNVAAADAVVPVVLARSDLYVMGFRCSGRWFRFDDAQWPFSQAVTKLGYDGRYASLGGLTGNLTAGDIAAIAQLADLAQRSLWKRALRTLLIALSECARLAPVNMQLLGLLNGVLPNVPLAPLAHYIQNWDKASKGMDMSKEAGPNLRTGFRDPTIIKR